MTYHDHLLPITEHNHAEQRRSRKPVRTIRAEQQAKAELGLDFTRIAIARAVGGGDLFSAAGYASSRWPNKFDSFFKAAIAAGTTTHPTWASPLFEAYAPYAEGFVEYLRASTIIGQFGTGSIPALTHVPFNVSVPRQVTGGQGYWVREGAAKPLTLFNFDNVKLPWANVANVAVISEELARWSQPSAELLVRDQLAAALTQTLDEDFVRPGKAEEPGVSPASITHDVTPVVSSGPHIENIRKDVKALFGQFIAARLSPKKGVWIMGSMTAIALSIMTNPLGALEFPEMGLDGGLFYKLPVIVSDHVPEGLVILASAENIMIADEGQASIDVSREASLEFSDNPTQNAATGTAPATGLISLWQTNSLGIRAERYAFWTKRRPEAVAYLTGVTWGSEEIFS